MDALSEGLERNGHDRPRPDRPSQYREHLIGSSRSPFTHLWVHRIGSDHQRVLPDNQSDIIVSSTGRAWVVGPATVAEVPALEVGTTLKGLRISTAWLRAIVGVPASKLTDRHVALDEILPMGTVRTLVDAIWEDRFDRELAGQLWPDAKVDRRVAHAVAALTSVTAPVISDLADNVGVSPRHLRRLVQQESGLTPKVIHQVARLRRAIDRAASADAAGIARIATSAGYSDQAHLSREARRFSGLTPKDLFGRASTALDSSAPSLTAGRALR